MGMKRVDFANSCQQIPSFESRGDTQSKLPSDSALGMEPLFGYGWLEFLSSDLGTQTSIPET